MEGIKSKVKITRKMMEAYEGLRKSGITNMFDLPRVTKYSGLTGDECLEIMRYYEKYMEEFEIEK